MRTEFLQQIKALHTSANPASLFASVQEAAAPDADDLAVLIDDAENKQLIWLARKDTVLAEIRGRLAAMDRPEARRTALTTLLDELDAFVGESFLIAERLRRHFKRTEKAAGTVSHLEAKRIHELGRRFVALTTRQIEAFSDVGDHLRALSHHYEETVGKGSGIRITLENAKTPAQLSALLAK